MKKIYTIGRDEGCDIVVPDSTDIISRLHATIRIESNDRIYITDQSRNGTYVNGMKMSSNVEIPVSRKDVVSFAHIYNLDWDLIPKQKGGVVKTVLIVFSCLAVLAVAAYLIFGKKSGEHTELQPEISTPVVIKDTVVVRDTVIVKPKAPVKNKSEKQKPEEDSVKVEKVEEEVYNPIY